MGLIPNTEYSLDYLVAKRIVNGSRFITGNQDDGISALLYGLSSFSENESHWQDSPPYDLVSGTGGRQKLNNSWKQITDQTTLKNRTWLDLVKIPLFIRGF